MVTFDEFVKNGLQQIKYEQLGGKQHDMSTDESDMYRALFMSETNQCKENDNIGIISILSSNGLF